MVTMPPISTLPAGRLTIMSVGLPRVWPTSSEPAEWRSLHQRLLTLFFHGGPMKLSRNSQINEAVGLRPAMLSFS
ncbi:hypothetical protein CC86DRAFT_365856 [Ophiobolus disseminans]|uniref:Uncharacterized protein n=1 Tax=Ophiobolus disseminans TaxID=1469910 RepID=A0A6A7AGZ3_9PLEO|nr:hypothetical protein CC86DRAFT_365856 [Ophiobolus disseminans]